MSSSLLRRSLYLVDPDLQNKKETSRKQKKATDLIPDNYRIVKKIKRKGKKATKTEVLHSTNKLTVAEARKNYKSKDDILKSNLAKIKLLKESCKVELEKDLTSIIIERAVTRRPVKARPKVVKDEPTAFTEEDFKKFEAEYFDE